MTDTEVAGPLIKVRLLGLPLQMLTDAQEHADGLTREFALIAAGLPSETVPGRLIRLARALPGQYSHYTEDTQRQIDEARKRGDAAMDIDFTVPASASQVAMELGALLDEADEYCRQGDLLTLATPPDLVAFRRWYLGEFSRQINGQPPTPWQDDVPA